MSVLHFRVSAQVSEVVQDLRKAREARCVGQRSRTIRARCVETV